MFGGSPKGTRFAFVNDRFSDQSMPLLFSCVSKHMNTKFCFFVLLFDLQMIKLSCGFLPVFSFH